MNNEVSDDWLISLYRNGDQIGIDCLYERYTSFIYGFINNIVSKGTYYDYSEFFQELIIVFINCLEKYDEERGKFYFFVKLSVERKMIDMLSKIKKEKQILSLDNFYYKNGDECIADYIQEENSSVYGENDLYECLKESLDTEGMNIVDMRVKGYSYQEISEILDISKQAIYRKIRLIKNIIKDIIEKID